MTGMGLLCLVLIPGIAFSFATRVVQHPPGDPGQILERTCFQTGKPWKEDVDLRADVALVYGLDASLPERIRSWHDQGYLTQVMTGVAWGKYQDYLYGRFDGTNHVDEAQTVSDGRKSTHGGDVYYMCPSISFGKFLCARIQPALDAGADAIHLEEPEFWVNSGYSEGFKREWQSYYGEPWQAPQSSVDAQWRASKLKYFLYRRTLQQVFQYVQDYNKRTGRHVRCYVATHSLLNYATWCIVSPESSLAQLDGCDGYIGQVWTGTARTPNRYRGKLRERTFETAFLEYGAAENLVRGTGRTIWFLSDPIEDNPGYDWNDYRTNWQATMAASLLHPQVWKYEVAPWPERIVRGRYPKSAKREKRKTIPAAYATELQIVWNALKDMNQKRVEWDCGTRGIGVLVSDSLMFQRGDPAPSDLHMGHFYGMAMPLLKRGMPIVPVQLENVPLPNYLDEFRVLLLTYQGMKPLRPELHDRLAAWVKRGGELVVCDDDSDPYLHVREWWNTNGLHFATPRQDLFERLGLSEGQTNAAVGAGHVFWLRENPAHLAASAEGAAQVVALVKQAAADAKLDWRETNCLLLRRGPYVIAAGLDESVQGAPKELTGKFVNLFDPELKALDQVRITPGRRFFLRDLSIDEGPGLRVLASAGRALPLHSGVKSSSFTVEGMGGTQGVILLRAPKAPRSIHLDHDRLETFTYSAEDHLLWIHFSNQAHPRVLSIDL